MEPMSAAGIFLLVMLYFVPTIIACVRGHHQKIAIGALNILLGWTAIGWIVALIWSVTAIDKKDMLVR